MKYYTVVGLKYYIKRWGTLKLNETVYLKAEPSNKYDKNAIACYYQDKKIGYISSWDIYIENKACSKYMKNIDKKEFKVCLCQGHSQPILINIKEKDS